MLMDTKIRLSSDLRKCRLCFEDENTLIYIYEVSGSLKSVARTISDVLNHEVSRDDQFPQYLCICCCGKLLEFRAFKMKCNALRETYELLLKSREDATNSTEEKLDIEDGSPEKGDQLSDRPVAEENSPFINSQVVQDPLTNDDIDLSIGVEEQGRLLRCRKVIDYNLDHSGSELSDPELSDSFCPSNQGDSDGVSSDDSISSGQILRKGKRFQVSREQVGTATSGRNPGSVTAGLEEDVDGRIAQTVCDPKSAAGFTVASSAVSIISSGNDGYSGSSLGSTFQSMGAWVGHSSSGAQQGSSNAHTISCQSDLSHSSLNSAQSSSTGLTFNSLSTTKDAVQLTNYSNASETRLKATLALQFSGRNAGSGKETNASNSSESITLTDLLKGHSFAPEVSNGSQLQSDALSCPRSSSLSWKDLFEGEVSNNSRSCLSQTTSASTVSLDKELMYSVDNSGTLPSRVDPTSAFRSTNTVDSAVASQSLNEPRNGRDSSEIMGNKGGQTRAEGRLYPGISTIDLKSFGISLETYNDDPEPEGSGGTLDELQSLGQKASLQSSESGILGLSGTHLTGESSNTENSKCMTAGNTSVQRSGQVKESVMLHEDQGSEANGTRVLETERVEVFNIRVQNGGGETVRKSIPEGSKDTDSANTVSVSNFASPSYSCNASFGVREGGLSHNLSNPSNIIPLASQSIPHIPGSIANSSYGLPRLSGERNLENTPALRAFSSQMYSDRIAGPTVAANVNGHNHLSHYPAGQEFPVSASRSNTVNTYATGHNPTSARYPNGYRNTGMPPLQRGAMESLISFQESVIQNMSGDMTVSTHSQSRPTENHPRLAFMNHLLNRMLSEGNSGCAVNTALVQREEVPKTVEASNRETNASHTGNPEPFASTLATSSIDMGISEGYPPRVRAVSGIDGTETLTNATELLYSANRSSGNSGGQLMNRNSGYASNPQGCMPSSLPAAVPNRLNGNNQVSPRLASQEGPLGGLNSSSVGTLVSRNVEIVSGNSSTYGRPAPYGSQHSLPACQLGLVESATRYNTAWAYLALQSEMRRIYPTGQSWSANLLDIRVPKTPREIAALARLLLQPEMRWNWSSTSHVDLPQSTSRYVAASRDLVAQPGRNDPDGNGEEEPAGSITADGAGGIENDFDMPVKKKTRERLCEVCGSVFYSARGLTMHIKGVHGEKRFKCAKCPKAFILKHHLAQHMSMHDDSRPFVCKECGSRFKLKTHLRQHVVVHSNRAMFQCSHCEKGFHTKWQHDNHQPSHEGSVVWSCDGCTEKSTTWAAYKDHLLEHKKNRTFKCDTCSNVYDTKLSLRRHVMSHIKPLECSVCGKRFGVNRALKAHMRTHTGERPYVCKVCGKGFARYHSLTVHMTVHSDERPFKCRFCGHRSKVKSYLKRHERYVHFMSRGRNISFAHLMW